MCATSSSRGLHPGRQGGASLLAAIFVIVILAMLGVLMVRMLAVASHDTVTEWYSTQALFAAESGVEWAAYDLVVTGGDGATGCDVGDWRDLDDDTLAWFCTEVDTTELAGEEKEIHTITSIGRAGGSATEPRAQREITVRFFDKGD